MNNVANQEAKNPANGKPVMLAPVYANIPEEMRDRRQWINWKLSRNPKPTGKPWTKIPLDPRTGRKAATTRPETWTDFDTACARHQEFSRHAGRGSSEGLGFVLRGAHVGIDLDDCRSPQTGELEPWAQEIVRRIDSYTEVSPSGTGIRIICLGKLPPGARRKGAVEMYDESSPRYLTITGHVLDGRGEIHDRQSQIEAVHAEHLGVEETEDTKPTPAYDPPEDLDTDQVLEKAMTARNGEGFSKLWHGEWQGDYPSQSEADLALAGELAFWCGRNPEAIDSMFRQSGLYRDKWERTDYREDTIAKAMDRDRFYDWGVDGSKIDEIFNSASGTPNLFPSNGKEEKNKPRVAGLPDIEDACDFCQRNLPLPPELIEGLLHQGSKMSLGGASKAYKSWALLNLALSVGYGMPWLGCLTARSKVLVINLEIQQAFCRKRLTTLADARGMKQERGRLDIWNLRGYATSHQEIFPKIVERVGDMGYGLIVLDPIYKLYGNTDENSARDVAALLNSIETVAVTTGAAVAFGTHFSKGNQAGKNSIDRVSGSGVFARDPDSILNLTAHEEADCFTLEATLRNFPPIEPFVVKWNYPLFVRDASLDPADLKTAGRPSTFTAERLLEALGNKAMNATDWMKAVGCGKDTFYRLRPELEKAGKVQQDNEKRWHRA